MSLEIGPISRGTSAISKYTLQQLAAYEGRPQPVQEDGEIQENRQDYAQQL